MYLKIINFKKSIYCSSSYSHTHKNGFLQLGEVNKRAVCKQIVQDSHWTNECEVIK